MEKNKKQAIILSVVAVVTLIIVVIGATYAYFQTTGGAGSSTDVNVITATSDLLTFKIDKEINISLTQSDLKKGNGSVSDATKASATLTASNSKDIDKTTGRYNIYFIIEKNKEFYKVAYNVVGQNGFEEIINNCYAESVLTFLNEKRDPDILPQYSNELLSKYYGQTLAFITKQFVFDKTNPSILETRKKALDLMSHSIIDYEKKS